MTHPAGNLPIGEAASPQLNGAAMPNGDPR
jgi:hypothetical protein